MRFGYKVKELVLVGRKDMAIKTQLSIPKRQLFSLLFTYQNQKVLVKIWTVFSEIQYNLSECWTFELDKFAPLPPWDKYKL
jgi:hypothetical protein